MALLVITGPPGAGKSTVAALVAQRYPRTARIEGDAFFAFLERGAIEPWLPAANEQNDVVIQAAAAATGRFAAHDYMTVYDGIVGPWFLPTFLTATELPLLHYVVLLPDVDRCVERVATRTGHGFSDEAATRKMHAEFDRADIARRHLLTNSNDDPNTTVATVIKRFEGGQLVYEQ